MKMRGVVRGATAVLAGSDDAKMTIASSSVFASAADATAATSSADWKAAASKIKSSSYSVEVFQIVH